MPDPTPFGPQDPKDSLTQNEREEVEMPFEADARKFAQITNKVTPHVLEQCIEPDTEKYHSRTRVDIPYGMHFLLFEALKPFGLDIVYGVDGVRYQTETTTHSTYPIKLVLFCRKEQSQTFQALQDVIEQNVYDRTNKKPNMTYARLLREMTIGVVATNTMLDRTSTKDTAWNNSEFGKELYNKGLLDRAALTSILIAYLEDPARVMPQERLLYDNLKGQGVEPFGYEELHGIAAGEVRRILQEHPEITFGTQDPE